VDEIKPIVGMSFDSIEAVEEFYKSYAHKVRFLVRIGSQHLVNDEVVSKKFLCSRQGLKKTNVPPTGKQKNQAKTRCECDAHVFVKLGMDKRSCIASLVDEHNHILVSPDKTQFLRSNRSISQRAKSTLYTCHKASIGTSQAYILLAVSDGGLENIGCTKDFQNYYRGLRDKIKNAYAQIFVAQLERKKEVTSTFFYDFAMDEEGKLVYVLMLQVEKL
jgi:hypothetical protein